MKLKQFTSKVYDLWYKITVDVILTMVLIVIIERFKENYLIVCVSYFLMIILWIHVIQCSIGYLKEKNSEVK